MKSHKALNTIPGSINFSINGHYYYDNDSDVKQFDLQGSLIIHFYQKKKNWRIHPNICLFLYNYIHIHQCVIIELIN